MLEQRLAPGGSEPRQVVELADGLRGSALSSMVRNREPVRLVSDPLQQIQALAGARQDDRQGLTDFGIWGICLAASGCAACLLTPATNDAGTGWGPGVAGTIVTPNLAGCIELADNSAMGLACAQTVQAAAQCVDYACRTSCPVTDDASRAAYLACTATAATGVCGTYTAAANVCIANEIGDSGPTNVSTWCFAGPDVTTQYAEMALFFCSS